MEMMEIIAVIVSAVVDGALVYYFTKDATAALIVALVTCRLVRIQMMLAK
jgi:hypothetical protein